MSKKKIIFISLMSLTVIFTSILICFAVIEGVTYQAAAKIADTIKDEDMHTLLNDAKVQQFIQGGDDISEIKLSETDLPIKTRSEAISKVTETFTSKDMKEFSTKLKQGLTDQDKAELVSTLNQHFNEEEILSLKILALQEFKKRNTQSKKE